MTPLTVAVSRSAEKLSALLLQRHVPQAIIDSRLNIVQGDIRDAKRVSETLAPPSVPVSNGTNGTVDLIVSGIGRPPIFAPNPLKPTFDDPTICEDAIRTILSALRRLPSAPKPVIVALSTTGISSRARDVPILMKPLYHWLLAVPHKDKEQMEKLLLAEMARPTQERTIKNFVIVRPSLLTDGLRRGSNKVRVGEETVDAARPAVGYTISRDDVGGWIFDELLHGRKWDKFCGSLVSITY